MASGHTKKIKEEKARPVRVRIYYEIIEKICEHGDFILNGGTVQGFRNYYFTSGLWLTWKLPRSKKLLLQSINKWKWRMLENSGHFGHPFRVIPDRGSFPLFIFC